MSSEYEELYSSDRIQEFMKNLKENQIIYQGIKRNHLEVYENLCDHIKEIYGEDSIPTFDFIFNEELPRQ